jgi:hypothetical protein
LNGLKWFSLALIICLASVVIANGCFAASDDIVIVKSDGGVASSDESEKREKAVKNRGTTIISTNIDFKELGDYL